MEKLIIEDDGVILRELWYEDKDEKFDIIKLTPQLSDNTNETIEYDLFHWPESKLTSGQAEITLYPTSKSACYDIASKLIEMGWGRKLKLTAWDSALCNYNKKYFTVDSVIENLFNLGDNFSSDITINIIITRKEVEKLRKDLKNLTGYKIWWIEEDSNIKYHNIIC